MKRFLLSMLCATLVVACGENTELTNDESTEKEFDLTKIKIADNPSEILEYIGKIGNDFDSALDSLCRLKNIDSRIIKEPLNVLFDGDNRDFYGITYGDCGMYSDVVDTKGNYYCRTWYSVVEKKENIQEESIFKENKNFTIDKGCASITYQTRIGNYFNSALDSLMKSYEPMLNLLATEGHYSGKGYNIDQIKINVDFDYDNRSFILLTITDIVNVYNILFTNDIIDDKGNHYFLIPCED